METAARNFTAGERARCPEPVLARLAAEMAAADAAYEAALRYAEAAAKAAQRAQNAARRAWQERVAETCQFDQINDGLTFRRSGAVEVRDTYFYRPKRTAEAWAQQIRERLAAAEIPAVVQWSDTWQERPKLSYYQLTITQPEPARQA